MKVITSRPILSEPTSNCCGMSSADGTYSNCGGCSSFDSYSNCCGMSSADGDGTLKQLIKEGREYLSEQNAERRGGRSEAVKNIANDRALASQTRRSRKETKRTDRQINRSSRKEARFLRRQDRKSKRNAKKLALIKVKGKERYFFPLSRVRLGKKKYKDGTTVDVKPSDQITVTTPTGEKATFDKNEVAKAMGVAKDQVTEATLKAYMFPLPKNVQEEQKMNEEVGDKSTESVDTIEVPENRVETANDGEIYLSEDVQNTNEPEKDVKDEEKGMSKTQKIVLWSAGIVVLSIVGYLIYKSSTKTKSTI